MAARVTAWYLAFGLIPLGMALARIGLEGRLLAVAAVHLMLLVVMAVAALHPEARWRIVADLLPLGLIPLMYAELPFLIAGVGSGFQDALVRSWESRLFGAQPSQALAGLPATRWVSEPLHAAYFSYYALIYAPLVYLYRRSDLAGFRESSGAVMLTFSACFLAFIVFPVQGPRYLFPPAAEMPHGFFRSLVVGVLEAGSSRGAAFPSSHMAVAAAQAFMAVRWRVPGASVVWVAAVMLGVGAVYGGFHYGVDMIAGAALGTAVALGVRRVNRGARMPRAAARAPS